MLANFVFLLQADAEIRTSALLNFFDMNQMQIINKFKFKIMQASKFKWRVDF